MTTIATDGRHMAGDGQVCSNDRIEQGNCVKVRRLADGRLLGVAGDAYNYDGFQKWMEEGGDVPTPEGSFSALTLSPDGTIRTWDEKGRSYVEQGCAAIGSGSSYALAAMDAGRTAEDAVKIACGRDVWSGGDITVLGL